MRVAATGGTPDLVIQAAEGELLSGGQLLPDGDTVLFTAGSAGTADSWGDPQIVVESLTSGDRTVLLPGRDARYVSTGHLVYALDDELFAVAFDADRLTVEGGSVPLVDGLAEVVGSESANFAISHDGTLFHLSGNGAVGQPVWVDRTGAIDVIDTVPPNAYTSPRLSPNGERVLVVADGDAWTYDLASGRESRVTNDGSVAADYADWTPSGTEIVYSSSRGSGGDNIWIQPTDGSGPARQLTALDGLVHFDAWAPDGLTFAAHHHPVGAYNATSLLMIQLDRADAEPDRWLEPTVR